MNGKIYLNVFSQNPNQQLPIRQVDQPMFRTERSEHLPSELVSFLAVVAAVLDVCSDKTTVKVANRVHLAPKQTKTFTYLHM